MQSETSIAHGVLLNQDKMTSFCREAHIHYSDQLTHYLG